MLQKLTLNSKTDIKTLFSDVAYKECLLELLKMNRKIKYSQMEDNLGVTERTIACAIDWLKENGYISASTSTKDDFDNNCLGLSLY